MRVNNYQSIIFQQECIRHRTPAAFTDEFLIFLMTLYGRKIETGDARITQYEDMTMFDVTQELRLRTKMLRADNTRIQDKKKEKERKEQDEAVNELLQLQ